jgi:hypothetical protein
VAFAYPSIIDVPRARIMDHFNKFGDAASWTCAPGHKSNSSCR